MRDIMITQLVDILKDDMQLKESDAKLLEHAKEAYQKLKHDLEKLNMIEHRLETEYETKKKEIEQGRKALQSACPHLELSYHPDPSGNNDSSYTCRLCKKEM